ncbi:hypothetical protein LTR66_014852 [Elasticomyces elasticus]|nr:hypothetical protein LTR66_014852 [Elasticomyces elasticus]
MGPLVRLTAQGIGLVRESMARKRTEVSASASEASASNHSNRDDSSMRNQNEDYVPELVSRNASTQDVDEEAWLADAAAEEFEEQEPPPYSKHASMLKSTALSSNIQQEGPLGRLPCPVIIPQRRPRESSRGFARAYAPVLANCGVSQEMFLHFIKDFYEASKANPIFMAVNVAAFVTGFIPDITATVVSILVQTAAETARQIQGLHRTNTFLDEMNNAYFRPRGLYCLLMTHKPDELSTSIRLDMTETVATFSTPTESKFKDKLRSIRKSSGTTRGNIELPECAPLVYPHLEKLSGARDSKLKEVKANLSEYYDRRSQAQFAHQNPESKLGGNNPEDIQFASRYSDPNHPASQGSLISLLTGGHLNPRAGVDKLRQKRRDNKREEANQQLAESGSSEQAPYSRVANREGVLKRVLRQDVLYLMVVNMPTEEELAAAMAAEKTNEPC